MKFNIAKDDLLSALTNVSKGMSSRSTLPILSGILIETTDEGTLVFQTTDLEISIRHTIPADIVEGGRCVVPGKLFSDIVKNLPDAAISVTSQAEQTLISCLDTSFTLSSLNPADFPYFPEVDADTTIKLPTKQLADAVKKVGRAVSRDESRAVLMGILFSVEGGNARLASTDSYRLAVADMKGIGELSEVEDFQATIPGKIFEDVSKLATVVDELSIGFSDNQIVFEFGNTVFVSRKIEGSYPNYKRLTPSEHEVAIKVNSAALTTAIKRVSLLAQAHTPIKFSFSALEQTVTVSAKTQDVGGATETVEASVDGPDIDIAFNHQYVLDGLGAVGDEALIELQTSVKAGIFKNASDDSFLYLAMPVRLS